ncbi:hypothetical protein J6TS2_33470 [Heyndrickxia sporothermodurans]|nr:hypothetical protein J6TS2_33470 [Heyndrickxia sporothermodurans]
MKRNVPITFRSLIILLISIVITLILLVFIFYYIFEINKSGKGWIEATVGASGNIAGGLIGGIVAYIVAAYQVNKTNEGQYVINIRNTFAIMRLINEELEYNEIVIDSILPYTGSSDQDQLLVDQLSDKQWINNATSIGNELPDQDFFILCDIYRRISLLKTKKNEPNSEVFIKETKDLISSNLIKVDQIIKSLKEQLN